MRMPLSVLILNIMWCGASAAVAFHEPATVVCRLPVGGPRGADLARLGVEPRLDLDYGAFRWLELTVQDANRLATAGVRCRPEPDARTVVVTGHAFDPLVRTTEGSRIAGEASGHGWRIVQFAGPIRDDWLAWFDRLGVEPVQYLPHHAYLMWVPQQRQAGYAKARAAPFVRWSGELTPQLKVARGLRSRGAGAGRLELLVWAGDGLDGVIGAVARWGGRVVASFPAQPDRRVWSVLVDADPSSLDELAAIPEVVWAGAAPGPVELAGEMSAAVNAGHVADGRPLPDYRGLLEHLGFDGTGVTWAVIDSGVDRFHRDLEIVAGLNYTGCETDPPGDDPTIFKHGTLVAGVVSGTASGAYADDEGFLYGLGVAPGAKLVVHNAVCDLDGASLPPPDGWASLSAEVLAAGAAGINNSWFTGDVEIQTYDSAARTFDFMVRDGDFATDGVAEACPMVFAAGNSGPGGGTLRPPNQAKNIVSVGALQSYRVAGDIDALADFSSRGPASDGRIVPTVVAPGEMVSTTRHRDGGIFGDIGLIDGTEGLYAFFEGTSSAAPHVSGSLAVITQWWRRRSGGADPSPALGRALLVNAAVDVAGAPPIPNAEEGWGRVDLGRVLDPGVAMVYRDQLTVLRDTGDAWELEFRVADPSEPLKVTVAWTDPPAAVDADPALVNDLDLEVELDGVTYLGNDFTDGWSATGGAADRLNNLENVFVAEPGEAGGTIRIAGFHIPGDGVPFNGDPTDQDFALVCRNCVAVGPTVRRPDPERRYGAAPAGLPVLRQVNTDAAGYDIVGDAANEPTLSVSPDDPRRMVMAWRQFDTVRSSFRTAGWATSDDGGCSWTFRGSIDPGRFRTDPVLAALGGGRVAFVGLRDTLAAVDVFGSDDDGASWSSPVSAYGGDKPWMAADPDRGAVYLAWSDSESCCGPATFSRSLDGGLTFEPPVEIPGPPVWGTMAVGPDGEVYVAGLMPDFSYGVARADAPYDHAAMPSFSVVSVDLGGMFALVEPPNPSGLASQIWVDVDRSDGPRRGAVYLLCAVDPPLGDPLDVRLARSDDGGATWTAPVTVVADDRRSYQWFPTLAVAPDGRVDVAYVDVPDPAAPEIGRVMFTSSYDGGTTFTTPIAVSPVFDSHVGWPVEQSKLGDYYHMASHVDGATLAFAATMNGGQDVWVAHIGASPCRP